MDREDLVQAPGPRSSEWRLDFIGFHVCGRGAKDERRRGELGPPVGALAHHRVARVSATLAEGRTFWMDLRQKAINTSYVERRQLVPGVQCGL